MGEDRFNALILLYAHQDIVLDTKKIVDMYALKRPRRITLYEHSLIFFCEWSNAYINSDII